MYARMTKLFRPCCGGHMTDIVKDHEDIIKWILFGGRRFACLLLASGAGSQSLLDVPAFEVMSTIISPVEENR